MSAHPGAFIVSTGRCGSTLMSELVNEHPAILSVSEFFMSVVSRAFIYENPTGKQFWSVLAKPAPGAAKTFDPGQNPKEFLYRFTPDAAFDRKTLPPILFVTLPFISDDPDALFFELKPVIEARPRAPLADHYRFLFDWLTAYAGKQIWVERSGGSLAMVNSLFAMYPNGRFIHVYRDGRDVALSINNHPSMRLFAHNWLRMRKLGIDLLRPPFELGTNRLIAMIEPFVAPFAGLEKQLATPLEPDEIGAFWSALIEVGLENLKQIPAGQKMDLAYEDLLADPPAVLRAFIHFVDPGHVDEDWIARAAHIPTAGRSDWQSLPPVERDKLERACEPGLEALGYRQ